MSGTTCTELPLLYVRFIEKLSQCTAVHFGFHVSDLQQGGVKKTCYCPCSKKIQTWRRQFGLDEIPQCNANGSFFYYALVQHLTSSHRYGIVDFHKITKYFMGDIDDNNTNSNCRQLPTTATTKENMSSITIDKDIYLSPIELGALNRL